jgi:Fic family protein
MPDGMVCLPSEDPLLCERGEKAARETTNTLKQLLYVVELVSTRRVQDIRESHVHELQRIAVDGIFPCAGEYRTLTRTATLEGGSVTQVPPEPAAIAGYVREALDVINGLLSESRAADMRDQDRGQLVLKAAAYALWRFNWIHPFAGGNGRTARALAYLVLCIDYGRGIPGKPSMPTLISRRRLSYERALRDADAADAQGSQDLEAMTRLVTETIIEQLEHAERDAGRRRRVLSTAERAKLRASRKVAKEARRKNRR